MVKKDKKDKKVVKDEVKIVRGELGKRRNMYKYDTGAIFGNWDRFHCGHEYILEQAFNLCENMVVAFTKSAFYSSPQGETWGIQDINFRKQIVETYINNDLNAENRVTYLTYDTIADALEDAHNVDYDVIVLCEKDKGRCWQKEYSKVARRIASVNKSEPAIYIVKPVCTGKIPICSSKLRKQEKINGPV